MKVGSVYAIIHRSSGTVYVGATVNPVHIRWNTHRCDLNHSRAHNLHLQAAWNKYGKDAFDFVVLERTPRPFEHEQAWIDLMRMDGVRLYNQNLYVDIPYMLGRTHTEEARCKIVMAHTGRKHSEQSRLNMGQSHLGNKSRTGQRRSDAEREKTSVAMKQAWDEGRVKRSTDKLRLEWIPFIRGLHRRGLTYRQLGCICGVSYNTIGDVCRRTAWRRI